MAKPIMTAVAPINPSELKTETLNDYTIRGWAYFSTQKFDLSSADFDHVVAEEPENIDSWYGLGLALKGSGTNSKALEAFEKVLELIHLLEDHQRANILGRLAKGQINQIKTGDWNLEKEIWKTVD
jgi:tetratricopeptide (TPR) repeat protein